MPAYTWRTLEELRTALRARLGMAASGSGAGANQTIINSFLQSAQEHVYQLQDWKTLISYEDKSIGVGQNALDYPALANPMRLYTPPGSASPVWVYYSSKWVPILEGFGADHWDSMDDQDSYPTRYERYDQLQFWPKSNAIYTVRIWFVKALTRFTQDADRASVDDNLIFLHALSAAKAHYRHPDAGLYAAQWEAMQAKIRGQSIGQNSVIKRGGLREMPLPKPRVV